MVAVVLIWGSSTTPSPGHTIGDNLDRTIARFADEALVWVDQGPALHLCAVRRGGRSRRASIAAGLAAGDRVGTGSSNCVQRAVQRYGQLGSSWSTSTRPT